MEILTDIYLGDSKEKLKLLPDNSVDLIVTSPPYADQRKSTYGGIHPDKYVDWFLPISDQLLRVLKPTGTFVLNIKEKVIAGERSTYVIELILAMRKQGWLWTEEFIWHKKNSYHGKGCFNLTRIKNSICTKKKLWFQWVIGQKTDLKTFLKLIK